MAADKSTVRCDIVVVGSGFSGILAADILAGAGLNVVVVDENAHVGGQLLRQIPQELGTYSHYHADYVKKIGSRFIEDIKKKGVPIINNAIVIGVYPEKKILVEVDEERVICLEFEAILFATGARERFIPFKGWTLPGVYSTGLVQVSMKSSGVLPAEEMVVGGSGLFLFAVAYQALKNGARVGAVLEQTGMLNKVKLLSQFFRQFSKFSEGARYLSRIYLSGVPVKYGKKIVEARGDGSLEEVVCANIDASGGVIPGSEKVYKTRALAVGYGFRANVELPQLAECELDYDEAKGGWVVQVDDTMATSVEDFYAAGEITGIAGALKSVCEGKLAGLSILKRFDKITDLEYRTRSRPLLKERKHHLTFGKYFNLLYRLPDSTILDIPDETVICRCEDVRMGHIRRALEDGCDNPLALKVAVRTGMGNCQGRICGANVYDIMAAFTKKNHERIGSFSVRPPIKPVSIASLATFKEAQEQDDQ